MTIFYSEPKLNWPGCISNRSIFQQVGENLTAEQAREVAELCDYPRCWSLYNAIKCTGDDERLACLFLFSLIGKLIAERHASSIEISPALQLGFALIKAKISEVLANTCLRNLDTKLCIHEDAILSLGANEHDLISQAKDWLEMARDNYTQAHELTTKFFVSKAGQLTACFLNDSLKAIDVQLEDAKQFAANVAKYPHSFQASPLNQ